MNVQRFFAGNSREALKNVKADLGSDAVILSNNAVDGGVEILAVAGNDISQLTQPAVGARKHRARGSAPAPDRAQPSREQPPEAAQQTPLAKAHAELAIARNVIHEIKSLRGVVEDQLASLAWGELARRDPLKSRVMRELLRCSFSAQFARQLVARMPPATEAKSAAAWVRSALALNLQAVPAEHEVVNRGGVYALVGPTGSARPPPPPSSPHAAWCATGPTRSRCLLPTAIASARTSNCAFTARSSDSLCTR